MQTIVLKPLYHRGKECIGIYFERNGLLQSLIQNQAGGRWSKTNSCWYAPLSKSNYEKLAKTLQGKAELKIDELKKYLLDRKKSINLTTLPNIAAAEPGIKKNITKVAWTIKPQKLVHTLSKENEEALQKFKQMLVLKSYSPSTIRTYTNELLQFLHIIKKRPASEFTTARIKDYLQYCHTTLKLSEATLHSRINSLKFYYEQVLCQQKFFWEIPRPKKPNQLPKVLGENEIGRMFNAVNNLKHKAILFTAYSAGLRASEVINLKIKDVVSYSPFFGAENHFWS